MDRYISPREPPKAGLVLRFAYAYFDKLCSLLSFSVKRLAKLGVVVDTINHYPDSALSRREPNTAEGYLSFEDRNPDLPPWLDPLLQIKSLEVIELC